MKAQLVWAIAIAGVGAVAFSAAAQGPSKLAVGPDAGGYLCPDGRQLYVKGCYDNSPNARCGVVLVHLPAQNGFQRESTETRSQLTPSLAACKVYPVAFDKGVVSLVLPKSAPPQQAARPVGAAPRALATKRLPETELEKKFFKGMQDNLFAAAMNAVLRASVTDKPVPVAELADKQGMTALHWAAASRNDIAVRWLLDKKSDIDLADEKGRTPLKIALDNTDARVMTILLDRGANARFALSGHDDELKGFKKASELAEFMIMAAKPAGTSPATVPTRAPTKPPSQVQVPARRWGRVEYLGEYISRIGDMKVEYLGEYISRIGDMKVEYRGEYISRIGDMNVEYLGEYIYRIGD